MLTSSVLMTRTRFALAALLTGSALIAAACGESESTSTQSADAPASSADADDSGDTGSGDTDSSDTGSDAADGDDTDATAGSSESSSDGEDSGWPHRFVEDGVGGGIIDANDYEGQDLVLWFWAPW